MKYRKGYKNQLADHFRIETNIHPKEDIKTEFFCLRSTGMLDIHTGYAWDGASGPTLNTDNTMIPALVHDAFYQLMRKGHLPIEYRKAVDNELDRMLKNRGMWWIRRKYWLAGVRLFGGSSADPLNVKEVHEVE